MTLAEKSGSSFSDTSLKTFAKFKEFKAEAEKQSGKYVKALRLDGGGEYNSKEFANFYKSQGIIMQTTTKVYSTTKWSG
jgi:hypothetical protein